MPNGGTYCPANIHNSISHIRPSTSLNISIGIGIRLRPLDYAVTSCGASCRDKSVIGVGTKLRLYLVAMLSKINTHQSPLL